VQPFRVRTDNTNISFASGRGGGSTSSLGLIETLSKSSRRKDVREFLGEHAGVADSKVERRPVTTANARQRGGGDGGKMFPVKNP